MKTIFLVLKIASIYEEKQGIISCTACFTMFRGKIVKHIWDFSENVILHWSYVFQILDTDKKINNYVCNSTCLIHMYSEK